MIKPQRVECVNDLREIRNRLIPQVSYGTFEPSDRHLEIFLDSKRCDLHPYMIKNDEGQIVAYAELHLMPHLARGWTGRIERVVVTEAARGRGLAKMLCNHLIDRATNLGCAYVDLYAENRSVRSLYEALGFVEHETTVYRRMC